MAAATATPADPGATLGSRRFIAVLVLAAIVGVIASVAAWAFLELLHHMKGWVYTDLPPALGFSATPEWWPLPVLAIGGLGGGGPAGRAPPPCSDLGLGGPR